MMTRGGAIVGIRLAHLITVVILASTHPRMMTKRGADAIDRPSAIGERRLLIAGMTIGRVEEEGGSTKKEPTTTDMTFRRPGKGGIASLLTFFNPMVRPPEKGPRTKPIDSGPEIGGPLQ